MELISAFSVNSVAGFLGVYWTYKLCIKRISIKSI